MRQPLPVPRIPQNWKQRVDDIPSLPRTCVIRGLDTGSTFSRPYLRVT